MRCINICPGYETAECKKLDKPPYVCNGCGKKTHCLMPLIKDKHQSIGHIYATHADELGCSRRTLYSYINDCVFEVRNSDLRRAVRYKKRKKATQTSAKDRSYRQDHNYEDFQKYLKDHPGTNVVEMDCVEGKKGESRAILTFTFRNCNLMLMFLLEYQDQECVLEVFAWLESVLGKETFKKLFPVILTDDGSEFSARKEMEEFCDGTPSTTIFYCDPYCFWQKSACERIKERIEEKRQKALSVPKPQNKLKQLATTNGHISFNTNSRLQKWATKENLQIAAQTYNQMKVRNIHDFEELAERISSQQQLSKLTNSSIVSIEHRLQELAEIIKYAEQYQETS